MAYRVTGSGPTLICHGGGPGFSGRYLGELTGLGDWFRLIIPDPRGTGGSDRPREPSEYAIDDYVGDVEELRQHIGEDRIGILGHSHGGVVAMAYAAAHPETVERLVLVGTLARFHEEQRTAMSAGMEARAKEPWFPAAVEAMRRELLPSITTDEEISEVVFAQMPLYFARYGAAERAYIERLRGETVNGDALLRWNREVTTLDLRPSLSQIAARALVITGAEDFVTGPVCAREIAAAIPDSNLIVLPGAGHMVFVEAPERFQAEVVGLTLP